MNQRLRASNVCHGPWTMVLEDPYHSCSRFGQLMAAIGALFSPNARSQRGNMGQVAQAVLSQNF